MTVVWITASIILGIIWLVLFFIGNGWFLFSEEARDERKTKPEEWAKAYRVYAALMLAGAVFVVVHWIVLAALIPAFILYGCYAAPRVLVKREWKDLA